MKPLYVLPLAVLFTFISCADQVIEPETRPEGPSVLSDASLKAAKKKVSFTQHVKPILQERCAHCHNDKNLSGGWNITSKEGFFAKGAKGYRVIPGHPELSQMIEFTKKGNHGASMPAVGNALTKEEREVLKKWISDGASWEGGKL